MTRAESGGRSAGHLLPMDSGAGPDTYGNLRAGRGPELQNRERMIDARVGLGS